MAEFENSPKVVCLETQSFYALIEEVVDRLSEKQAIQNDKWISDEEAMRILRFTSRTTMQKLRGLAILK